MNIYYYYYYINFQKKMGTKQQTKHFRKYNLLQYYMYCIQIQEDFN